MPGTAWTDLTATLREARGRFRNVTIRRDELARYLKPRLAPLEYYEGNYMYRFPMRTSDALPAAWGSPGLDGSPEQVTEYFYPKSLYSYLEIDAKTAQIAKGKGTVEPGVASALRDKITNAERALRRVTELSFWGDGSGRLAEVAKVVSTETYSDIWVRPVFSYRPTYWEDSTKYIQKGYYVDFATYSEAAQSGTLVANATGHLVTAVTAGTTGYASGLETEPHIRVTPAVPDGVTASCWVVLHNSLDAMPFGLMGFFGGSAGVAADTYEDDADMPRYGLRTYGSVNSQTYPEAHRGIIYNKEKGLGTASLTLTPEVLDEGFILAHSHNPDIKIQVLIGNPYSLKAYMKTYTTIRPAQVVFTNGVPSPDYGFKYPTYTSYHGDGTIPLIGMWDCPRGWLFGIDFSPIMVGEVPGSDWSSGNRDGIWNDMLNIRGVKADTLVAAYRQYLMYVQHDRRSIVAWNMVNESPS